MTYRRAEAEKNFNGELDYLCNLAASGRQLNETVLAESIYSIAKKIGNDFSGEKAFTDKSRIALVIPYNPLDETGGLEIGTRMIAQGISQLGNPVEIISRGYYPHHDWSGEYQTPEGITVHGVGSGIEEINQYLFQNIDLYEVIQWMEIFPPVPEKTEQYNDKAEQQYLASVLLRAKGKRVYLYTATSGNVKNRGTNNPDWFKTNKHQTFNFLIPAAFTGIDYANQEIANEYIAAGIRIESSRQKFIPFGVDTSAFKAVENVEEQKNQRQKLGLPLDKLLFLYLGRFVQRKRADFLLDVWNQLPEEIHKKATLVFAGGKAGAGQADSIYETMMQRLPQSPSTQVLDYVPHENMASLLQACDIMVFPTLREGFPLVLLEAMASGIPAISTNIDGIKTMIQNGKTGTLITPDSAKELSEAIMTATSDPDQYKAMGKSARLSVESLYGWNNIAKMYRDFFSAN